MHNSLHTRLTSTYSRDIDNRTSVYRRSRLYQYSSAICTEAIANDCGDCDNRAHDEGRFPATIVIDFDATADFLQEYFSNCSAQAAPGSFNSALLIYTATFDAVAQDSRRARVFRTQRRHGVRVTSELLGVNEK